MFNKVKVEKRLIKYRRIDESTNCWLWIGHRTKDNYGRATVDKKRYLTHRLSLFVWLDFDLNSDKLVLHKQNCLNKNCFNPDHLYTGTAKDNANDAVDLGKYSTGFCDKGHRITSIYRDKDRRNKIRKYCAICRKYRVRRWRERNKIKLGIKL